MALVKFCLLLVFGLLCSSIIQPKFAFAITYRVGDHAGWAFGVSSWPQGKHFMEGDVLEFVYQNAYHNVVAVSKKSYDSCTIEKPIAVYQSGDDHVTLKKGSHYYVCAINGHCQMGMKIAVTIN